MAPKTQYTKESILQQAFDLAVAEGISGISVRKLASRLGCSVAPIYQNFENTQDLIAAVKEKIRETIWTYSTKPYTNLGFYNIGIGQILFARDYPILLRDLVTHNMASQSPDQDALNQILHIMAKDPLLKDLKLEQLGPLLQSMALLTLGICIQMINEPTTPAQIEAYIKLLGESGSQLVYAYQNPSSHKLYDKIQWQIEL